MVARQLLLWTVGSAVCAVSSASYSWVGQLQAPLQRQRQRQQQQQQQQQRRRQQRSSVVVAQETFEKKKVVITGLGTLTSLGNDVDTFFDNLLEGKCGIGPVTNFDAENSAVKIASEVTGFEIGELWEPKDAKRYDRYTHLALGAAYGALADGGMKMEEIDPFRFGVLIGSSCGGITAVENSCRILFEKGPKRITPFLLPSIIGNTAGSMVAIQLGCKGPNYGIVSSCATANHAIGEALKCLQLGDADIMLAGGTEAAVTSLGVAGFSSMHEMCTTSNDAPQKASRPFDTDRSGFVMGEGAGVLLMETEEHAKARGAKIYCELAGYAANCEAYNVVGGPTPEGAAMADCMSLAMSQAGVSAGDVDYVNAHGTSVAHDDKVEGAALQQVFGAHKPKISSIKGATGHTLGAAGGIEAAVVCKVMQTGQVPPTINLDSPDPALDGLDLVPNTKYVSDAPLKVAVSDNAGFGGHNAALVFKRYE